MNLQVTGALSSYYNPWLPPCLDPLCTDTHQTSYAPPSLGQWSCFIDELATIIKAVRNMPSTCPLPLFHKHYMIWTNAYIKHLMLSSFQSYVVVFLDKLVNIINAIKSMPFPWQVLFPSTLNSSNKYLHQTPYAPLSPGLCCCFPWWTCRCHWVPPAPVPDQSGRPRTRIVAGPQAKTATLMLAYHASSQSF